MKYFLLSLCLAFGGFISYSQSGDFYLKEFNIHLPNIDNDNYAIVQDELGRMRIANRKGLLKFDGTFWGITPTPGTVFSIKNDSGSKITFVGCINDFGYVSTDPTGHDHYVSISKGDKNVKNIARIEIVGDFVYFLGEQILFIYSKTEHRIVSLHKGNISNLLVFGNAVYACYEDNKIRLVNIKSTENSTFSNAPQSNFSFTTPINSKTVLVGTTDNNLFLLKDKVFSKIKLLDSAYIQTYEVLDAVMIGKETAVIATAKGGCLIVNIKNGYTLATINVYSGLPDDEVYAIGKDASGGVWIAHEFGISRMDYHIPFLCYSNYLGLEGHLETALSYQGKLYVGTNEGLFALEELKEYKELVEKKTVYVKSPNLEADDATEIRKKERFNFRNLLKKKHKPAPVAEQTAQNLVRKETLSKKRILTSVKYHFVRVGNIKSKCNQLVLLGNKLIASTNGGIYEISGNSITKLCDENIRYLYASSNNRQIHASTADESIITLVYDGKKWEKFSIFEFINQPITCISEDPQGNLWLAGVSRLYKVRLGQYNDISQTAEIEINNPYSDDIHLFNYENKINFSLSASFYYFDPNKNKLEKNSLLEETFRHAERVIYSQNDALWILKNKYWELLSDPFPKNDNFVYLSLFKNVDEYVIDKERKVIWVLTDKNQLYSLNLSTNNNALAQPDILVHNIKNARGEYLSINNFSVQQEESNLLLNVVSPDYYNQNALDYQYKIVGYSKDWSHWSNSNTIILNYLSSGDYTINVRSRNAFGQITEKEAVKFTIKPPFWQTWWFYLLEVVFFGSLWLLSFKLNRSSNANDIIRKALTFLTLVITIEFLSTLAESLVNFNISPVLDFLVKVCIAVSLVPIERLLSKFIARNNMPS